MIQKPSYKALCPYCVKRVSRYGYPALWMLANACECFADGCMLVYDKPYFKTYNSLVAYLEKKGYFISTEIDLNSIAVVPNTTTGIYYEIFGYYCWCVYDVDLFPGCAYGD